MRDNVGIAELSSPMLRDLLREACASVGRVVVYSSLDDAKNALLLNPPKILVLGGAPLDPALLELLKRAVSSHSVIGLAVADDHDLQLASHAGAVEGFARTPEGLRQLAMRLRPMLAPSMRPPPSQALMSSSAPPSPNAVGAERRSKPPASDEQCALIALGSFAARGDAVAYLLSRLPTTLPGIVLIHGHIQPNAELKHLIAEECSWRVHEAGEPGVIAPGSVWIAHRSTPWQLRSSHAGIELVPKTLAADSGRKSLPPAGIDTFLESVGQTLGARALGVLLGATGDEGSFGLWALKTPARTPWRSAIRTVRPTTTWMVRAHRRSHTSCSVWNACRKPSRPTVRDKTAIEAYVISTRKPRLSTISRREANAGRQSPRSQRGTSVAAKPTRDVSRRGA